MRTGRIIIILLLAVISLLSVKQMNATTAPQRPDFAYPKTVNENARKSLAAALSAGDGPGTVRALIDSYLAETRIDSSNATAAIAEIDSIACATSDGVLKAMLLTLEADIYSAVYSSSRWKYDSRTLPLTPFLEDFNEWSGEQFRTRIAQLTAKALGFGHELQATPITDYASVIDLDGERYRGKLSAAGKRLNILYYPTLYDFVASQSIGLLTSAGQISTPLPWSLLSRHDLYVGLPFTKYDPAAARVLDIYASLLRFHKPGSAPFIRSDIERLDFIASHIYDADGASDEPLAEKKCRLLRELYDENAASEYSGDILLGIPESDGNAKWLYGATLRNLKAFPAYPRRDALTNLRLRIEEQQLRVSYPEVTAPGLSVKLNVEAANVKKGKIYIYDVSSSPVTDRSYNCTGLPTSMKPVAVLPFAASTGSEVPFREKIELDYAFPAVGSYIAIATIDGVTPKDRRWYDKISVTRYALASSGFDTQAVWTLDAMTGAPVGGAKISINDSRTNSNTLRPLGTTDADGSLTVKGSGSLYMDKDGDRFTPPVWIYGRDGSSGRDRWLPASSGYSSLPVYHPGDSVGWMAIVYEYRGKSHRPIVSKEVTAVLRDASYQPIDTLRLTTDGFGRVAGSFTLPSETLSGRFVISLDQYADPVSFMVSDYKLPTFRLILDPVEKDFPSAGDVTVRGRVETYAGFPVADSRLTLSLSASPRRWWWQSRSGVTFRTIDATSDSGGKIEITIPKEILELSPIPGGIFSADIAATSPSGETQTAALTFSTGTRYVIRVSAPENVDITAPTALIKTQVVNYQDSVIAMPVNFAVLRDSAELLSGRIAPDDARLDLSTLPSGRYDIRFTLPDAALAEAVSQSVVLYRPTDKATPLPGTLLWSPDTKVDVSPDGSAQWLYAVHCPTNLLVTIHTGSRILSRRWVEVPEGMGRLPVSLPEGVDNADMEIALTGKYRRASLSIPLTRPVPEKGLKFTAESFRDRVTPGSEETWTFRVTDESEGGQKAAVVLDMFNTALDALATQSWQLYPATQGPAHYYSWTAPSLSGRGLTSANHLPGRYVGTIDLVTPEFNTYGLPLSPLRLRGGIMMKAASRSAGAADLDVVREHKEEILVTVQTTSRSLDYPAETAPSLTGSVNGMADEAATEADGGGAQMPAVKEAPFTFRDREVALAFFRPMLTTDADGRLSFTFTVPDANTTWGFRALAYTDSLISTTFSADVTASKPVMVQPNLPRFVRAGDVVTIPASVMNGSDTAQEVETTIEIFSAADGKVIATSHHTDTIAPDASVTVSTRLTAPTDAPFIGYRIKSSTVRFADGEQTLLPVLPAVTPVIDTYPFYIAPDERKFAMQLPKVPADSRVTLQYCDNPTWYVVTALPGLLDSEASTANEAAASIFSAAVAAGLLRDNPVIADALRQWSAGDRSDLSLTSMLDRNADLRQMLLAATPWMLDAKTDNERMSRLALLFDKSTVGSVIKANTATLKKLTRADGGWAWNSYGQDASRWATENVLLLLGRLHGLGFFPDSPELRRMTLDALGWLDSEAKATFRKYPEADFTLYVYLRDRFGGFKDAPAPDRTLVSTTVQRILADWKKASVGVKGIYARILADNSQPSVAKSLLASLREYSAYSPTEGMWWPSLDDMSFWSMGKIGTTALILDAFAAIEPGCVDIDRIRQWLILQKEAKDWGVSVTTSSAIASILSTSRRWIAPAGEAVISVAGKKVQPDNVGRLTGYFRTPLPLTPASKGELRVDRTADTPAWGALCYLFTDSITAVKPHACPELSIEKRFAVGGSYLTANNPGTEPHNPASTPANLSADTPAGSNLGASTPANLSVDTPAGSSLGTSTPANLSAATPAGSNLRASTPANLSVDTPAGSNLRASTPANLSVGDKVTVTLTLNVGRDMDYVTIVDDRPACFEPTEQMPTPIFAEGICFYRENRDSSTRLFIDHLPKGTYVITYDMWVNNAGTFASGVATVQSQYAPQFTAHTSGTTLTVVETHRGA
ncbi:MAG: hypothetical protein HDR85_00125 [Bacteroides sp.]|nr:hypothetical protein [Bacteroides sp.]